MLICGCCGIQLGFHKLRLTTMLRQSREMLEKQLLVHFWHGSIKVLLVVLGIRSNSGKVVLAQGVLRQADMLALKLEGLDSLQDLLSSSLNGQTRENLPSKALMASDVMELCDCKASVLEHAQI